ncbi:MAG: hypothetical protein L0219_09825 [Phycisphaerales bacterium]|nr:hypothetical protein [Phycisphaerales bacterium]
MLSLSRMLKIGAITATSWLGTQLLADTTPARPGPPEPQPAHAEPAPKVENSILHEQPDRAAAQNRVDAWEKLLSESKFATLACRLKRVRTERDTSKQDSQPEIKQETVLRAQAVMKRDANWLIVWEGEEVQHGDQDRPALKLECVNGQVREDMWYPAFEQYRTKRYPAPTPFGANDTKYEHGCMIGGLLSTWLGIYKGARTQINRMREAEVLPDPVELSETSCRVFRYTFPSPPDEQPHTMTYFLGPDGRLMRWETVVTGHQGNLQIQVTATEDFDFKFFDEVPPEAEPPSTPSAPDPSSTQK